MQEAAAAKAAEAKAKSAEEAAAKKAAAEQARAERAAAAKAAKPSRAPAGKKAAEQAAAEAAAAEAAEAARAAEAREAFLKTPEGKKEAEREAAEAEEARKVAAARKEAEEARKAEEEARKAEEARKEAVRKRARERRSSHFSGPYKDFCKEYCACCVSADGTTLYGCVPFEKSKYTIQPFTYTLPLCLHICLCPQQGGAPHGCEMNVGDGDKCGWRCALGIFQLLLVNPFLCCCQVASVDEERNQRILARNSLAGHQFIDTVDMEW